MPSSPDTEIPSPLLVEGDGPPLSNEQQVQELLRRALEVTACAGTGNEDLARYHLTETVFHIKAFIRQMVIVTLMKQKGKDLPLEAAGLCSVVGYFFEQAKYDVDNGSYSVHGYPIAPGDQLKSTMDGIVAAEEKGEAVDPATLDTTIPTPPEMPSLEPEGPKEVKSNE